MTVDWYQENLVIGVMESTIVAVLKRLTAKVAHPYQVTLKRRYGAEDPSFRR